MEAFSVEDVSVGSIGPEIRQNKKTICCFFPKQLLAVGVLAAKNNESRNHRESVDEGESFLRVDVSTPPDS